MLGTLVFTVLSLTAQAPVPRNEPVLGGQAEIVCGIRAHPEQVLGLYVRRSSIAAYIQNNTVRQSANDPFIRVGETRTKVVETRLEGRNCLMLESRATREILGNNPMEGQTDIRVKRRITRLRRVWVGEDGTIVKTYFEQMEPEAFSVDISFGNGSINVIKKKGEKTESGQIDTPTDPIQFENEFLTLAWNGKVQKETKTYTTFDPFGGGIRNVEAKFDMTFQAIVGTDRAKGVRYLLKDSAGTIGVWVTDQGELLQIDMPTGERLMVEPQVGETGIQKVRKIGG